MWSVLKFLNLFLQYFCSLWSLFSSRSTRIEAFYSLSAQANYSSISLATLSKTAWESYSSAVKLATESCPFKDDIVESISLNVHRYVGGQDEAIDTILRAISAWELRRRTSSGEPLVLAFSGPTGVGKSETSFRIAEGLLSSSHKVGGRLVPKGLLILRGEDYSSSSALAQKGLGEIFSAVRKKLEAHYAECGGNAVIIIDEVQKVVPGALEALTELIDSRGSISFPTPKSSFCSALSSVTPSSVSSSTSSYCPSTTHISTANSVFILISDIASEVMIKVLLAYQHRSLVPTNTIREVVKDALDAQWERLKLGKYIKEVVPFLPLERQHIQHIFAIKVQQIGIDLRSKRWRDLMVRIFLLLLVYVLIFTCLLYI